MKDWKKIAIILIFTVLMGIVIMSIAGCQNKTMLVKFNYDPNDPAYKFIPAAPNDWVEKFGDNERTRLLHTISELRVITALQGRRILELEKCDFNNIDSRLIELERQAGIIEMRANL